MSIRPDAEFSLATTTLVEGEDRYHDALNVLVYSILKLKETQNVLAEELFNQEERIQALESRKIEERQEKLDWERQVNNKLSEQFQGEKICKRAVLLQKQNEAYEKYLTAQDESTKEHYKNLYESIKHQRDAIVD